MGDMFNEVKTVDWGLNTTPLYGGRKVDVIEVKGNQRKISFYVPGEPEPTKRWVDVADLKEMPGTPIPPKGETPPLQTLADSLAADQAEIGQALEAADTTPEPENTESLEAAVIAQKEIDLAKQRDDMQAEIESLNSRLRAQIETAQKALNQRDEANLQIEDYDRKLKAQLERSNVLVDERDRIKRDAALRIAQLRTALGAMPDSDELDYLERLIMHSMADLKGEIDTLKAQGQLQPAAHQKIEFMTLEQRITGADRFYPEPGSGKPAVVTLYKDLADIELTKFVNDGWQTVPELCNVISSYSQDDGGGGSATYRVVTLKRDAQDTAHPPMEEAREKSYIPTREEVAAEMIDEGLGDELLDFLDLEVEPDFEPATLVIDDDEPAWKSETDPVKRDAMIYAARKATIGQAAAGRKIAQTNKRKKRERAQGGAVQPGVMYLVGDDKPVKGVRVGPLVFDPAKNPLVCALATHGLEATTAVLDEQLRQRALAAMQRVQQTQAQRPLVPLLLGQ